MAVKLVIEPARARADCDSSISDSNRAAPGGTPLRLPALAAGDPPPPGVAASVRRRIIIIFKFDCLDLDPSHAILSAVRQ